MIDLMAMGYGEEEDEEEEEEEEEEEKEIRRQSEEKMVIPSLEHRAVQQWRKSRSKRRSARHRLCFLPIPRFQKLRSL